jgi:hypothetical protein
MTDPKPLPTFTLPALEPPRWSLLAMCGDISRPATVDDLRAVVLALPVADRDGDLWWLGNAIEKRERAASAEAHDEHGTSWKLRALAAEARAEKAEASERFMRQAPSFARSCVGTGERDEPRWRARAETAEADLAEILDWAFSKCDSDEPEETAMAQVQLLWQEMVDECETQAAEIDGLKLLLRKAQAGCPCES